MEARFLNEAGTVVRITDETGSRDVPVDPANVDYAALVDAGTPIDAYEAPAPTADMVRAEARRRILALYPEWKQANLSARALELVEMIAQGETLTTEEQAERDEIDATWQWIKSVRAASNGMEADPPADFTSDHRWPANPA